jgi:uncharacterized phage protein (TIGR01671 family)
MREFKFRAWDENKMYYQVRCGGMFDDIPTAPTTWSEKHGDWVNLTGQPYTKIMQFTGLKDKNGNEIYEGDIVKYLQRNLSSAFGFEKGKDFTEEKRVIRFLDQSFNVPQGFIKELEIIGNIYENKDLLK